MYGGHRWGSHFTGRTTTVNRKNTTTFALTIPHFCGSSTKRRQRSTIYNHVMISRNRSSCSSFITSTTSLRNRACSVGGNKAEITVLSCQPKPTLGSSDDFLSRFMKFLSRASFSDNPTRGRSRARRTTSRPRRPRAKLTVSAISTSPAWRLLGPRRS